MDIKYTNHTDIIVAIASLLSIIIMAINTLFHSVIPLYIIDVVTVGTFIYWSICKDPTKILVRCLIMGGIVGILYTFLDSLFAEVEITTYLRNDLKIMSTPVSVVLFWTFFITTMMYLYHRLRSVFSKFYFPSLITGTTAFLFNLILLYLGSDNQWNWNVLNHLHGSKSLPSIGPIPLYVPLAFFVTFLSSPYIVGIPNVSIAKDDDNSIMKHFKVSDNPLSGGLRCTIMLSVCLYGLYQLFTRLQLYL
jgi:hypothetical protein